MVRIRQAGWLIGIAPLVLAFQILRDIEIQSNFVNVEASDILLRRFGFWADAVPSAFRPRLGLNLVLFLAAAVIALVAIVSGAGRVFVAAIAAVQAVVALTGFIWDFDTADAPDVLLHTIPVTGGRWTSFFLLAFAVTALVIALTATESRPAGMTTSF
jgi:hypothetical protein